MARTAVKIKTFDYILRADRDQEDPTVFELSTLPGRVKAKLLDKATTIVPDAGAEQGFYATVEANEVAWLTTQHALRGWRNFHDEGGSDVSYKSIKKNVAGKDMAVASEDSMDLLELEWIQELSEATSTGLMLLEEDAKNSDS